MTVSLTPGPWLTALYPGETTPDLQARIDEVLNWVFYFAPCLEAAGFSNTGNPAKIVHSLIKRAMAYDKSTADGQVVQRTAGPFSTTYDNRRTTAPNIFADKQIEVLKSLCGRPAEFGAVTVQLGLPHDVP